MTDATAGLSLREIAELLQKHREYWRDQIRKAKTDRDRRRDKGLLESTEKMMQSIGIPAAFPDKKPRWWCLVISRLKIDITPNAEKS